VGYGRKRFADVRGLREALGSAGPIRRSRVKVVPLGGPVVARKHELLPGRVKIVAGAVALHRGRGRYLVKPRAVAFHRPDLGVLRKGRVDEGDELVRRPAGVGFTSSCCPPFGWASHG